MNEIYEVKLTELAQDDLVKIHDYIANTIFNNSAAKKQTLAFIKTFKNMKIFPHIYSKVQNELLKNYSLRKAVVNKYIAFFEINEESKTVNIIRILYGMSNYSDIL